MLFGDEYEGATGVLQLLFVSFIPFAFTTPAVNTLIYAFKRPQIIALTTLAQSPIVLISNFYLIPKIGIFAPVLTIGLVNTSTLLISYYFVWKYFNETSKKLS
jgi:O-antigen/teichoic acid export membrane protein